MISSGMSEMAFRWTGITFKNGFASSTVRKMTLEEFKTTLRERLSGTDINRVKEDALPFLKNPGELDIWSNDYFLLLADQMTILE